MGVYHLMGLGLSPGVVTGPLSYLAHRYQRWNDDDRRFFARSGEINQREAGEKVGDVQAIVLFTTREVLTGKLKANKYVENSPGTISTGPEHDEQPMKQVLERLLKKVWPKISGGRKKGSVFWCEVDRRNMQDTFTKVTQVSIALSRKEQWGNLTGGNNVINFALELTASLSGNISRLYYVQAENRDAEGCAFHTRGNGYWVDLPVMPLALSRVSTAILTLLQNNPMTLSELHPQLLNNSAYSGLVWNIPPVSLLEDYLTPMWKQGLITASRKKGPYTIGPQWELVQPYQRIIEKARERSFTIEQLSSEEAWIERQEIILA